MSLKKVFVCDDHTIIVEGLELLFKNHAEFMLIGQTHRGMELLSKLKELKPDILLLDLNLKDSDGFTLLEQIRKKDNVLKIIFLTMYQDEFLIQRAQKEGANGYLQKSVSNKELLHAFEQVYHQPFYISGALQNDIENRKMFRDHFADKMKLTRREVELIPLLAAGKSSTQIATELFVSAHTIDTHRKNIFKKLKINNIIELVNFAHENRLL
jgi:DNA-binding NarL/FixJ family response regulator